MKIKNIIIATMLCILILPMVMAISPAPNGECYKYEPVKLDTGFNGVSIITDYDNLTQGDVTVELASGVNFEGFSALRNCIQVTTLSFYDGTDTKNYNDAVTAGWVSNFGVVQNDASQDTKKVQNNICPLEAYWITTDRLLNVTYSGVYGSPVGETFDWADLRLSNGTEELSYDEAHQAPYDWVESVLRFYNTSTGSDKFICKGIEFPYSSSCQRTFAYSWEGLLIVSELDNIYLITNNETEPCNVKVKCNAKFVGDNGICKPKPYGQYVGSNKIFKPKYFTSHAIRLWGALRDTIG